MFDVPWFSQRRTEYKIVQRSISPQLHSFLKGPIPALWRSQMWKCHWVISCEFSSSQICTWITSRTKNGWTEARLLWNMFHHFSTLCVGCYVSWCWACFWVIRWYDVQYIVEVKGPRYCEKKLPNTGCLQSISHDVDGNKFFDCLLLPGDLCTSEDLFEEATLFANIGPPFQGEHSNMMKLGCFTNLKYISMIINLGFWGFGMFRPSVQVMTTLTTAFHKVFFCFGNHEAWTRGEKKGTSPAKDSLEKLERIHEICRNLGVYTTPVRILAGLLGLLGLLRGHMIRRYTWRLNWKSGDMYMSCTSSSVQIAIAVRIQQLKFNWQFYCCIVELLVLVCSSGKKNGTIFLLPLWSWYHSSWETCPKTRFDWGAGPCWLHHCILLSSSFWIMSSNESNSLISLIPRLPAFWIRIRTWLG